MNGKVGGSEQFMNLSTAPSESTLKFRDCLGKWQPQRTGAEGWLLEVMGSAFAVVAGHGVGGGGLG